MDEKVPAEANRGFAPLAKEVEQLGTTGWRKVVRKLTLQKLKLKEGVVHLRGGAPERIRHFLHDFFFENGVLLRNVEVGTQAIEVDAFVALVLELFNQAFPRRVSHRQGVLAR